MKKLILAAIVLSNVFLACKKDRTCACTVKKTGTSTTTAALTFSVPLLGNVPVIDTSFVTPVNEVYNFDRVYNETSKRAAKNNCLNYSEPYNERSINEAPPLQLTTTSTGTRTYECDLK